MTAPADADLMRAAGIEKMARAGASALGYAWEDMPVDASQPRRVGPGQFGLSQETLLEIATAALAAWEGHCAQQKAPAG